MFEMIVVFLVFSFSLFLASSSFGAGLRFGERLLFASMSLAILSVGVALLWI